MATNPMQRKARNSFILGMLVMLVICGVIIAFLFIQITNLNKKEQENKQASVKVYVLSQDVGSGQVITTDMFTMQTVNKNLVPSNATSDLSVIENYALQDKEGNEISIIEIVSDEEKDIVEDCIFDERIACLYKKMGRVLNKREMTVISERYGLFGNDEKTQCELAKELGISRSYVSRIEKKALEKLKKLLEDNHL